MEIKYRTATKDDIPTLLEFENKLGDFERPFDPTIPKEGEVHYNDIPKSFESPKAIFFVAEHDSKVVAMGMGEIKKGSNWSNIESYGYIPILYVKKDYRSEGIGKKILNMLVDWFKDKDIPDIRLKVYSKNINAYKAYQKYGFDDYVLEMRYDKHI